MPSKRKMKYAAIAAKAAALPKIPKELLDQVAAADSAAAKTAPIVAQHASDTPLLTLRDLIRALPGRHASGRCRHSGA